MYFVNRHLAKGFQKLAKPHVSLLSMQGCFPYFLFLFLYPFSLSLPHPQATLHYLLFHPVNWHNCAQHNEIHFLSSFPPHFSIIFSLFCVMPQKSFRTETGEGLSLQDLGQSYRLSSIHRQWCRMCAPYQEYNMMSKQQMHHGRGMRIFLFLVQKKQHMKFSVYAYFNPRFCISLLLLTKASSLLFQLMEVAVFKDSDSKTRRDCLVYASV